jgi:hypothetical protein
MNRRQARGQECATSPTSGVLHEHPAARHAGDPPRPSSAVLPVPRPASYQSRGRLMVAGSAETGCTRPPEQRPARRRTLTNQCRSWRQWERRYGQRACSPRSIRGSSQTNTFMAIQPPYPRDWPSRPRETLEVRRVGVANSTHTTERSRNAGLRQTPCRPGRFPAKHRSTRHPLY